MIINLYLERKIGACFNIASSMFFAKKEFYVANYKHKISFLLTNRHFFGKTLFAVPVRFLLYFSYKNQVDRYIENKSFRGKYEKEKDTEISACKKRIRP